MGVDLYFPPEYLRAALVVSFLSVCVLVGLFCYLNFYTKRRYFTFWTIAWLFYALWLMLCVSLQKVQAVPLPVMRKQWSVACASMLLLWGSARFLRLRTNPSQLGLFLTFLSAWRYLAAHRLDPPLQAQPPIFCLMGLVSVLTAG